MKTLIVCYGLNDPIEDDMMGVFKDESLKNLYSDFIQDEMGGTVAAFKVGAYIEEIDIDDLTAAIVEMKKSDIAQVYSSLRCAAYNHLLAFVSNIEASPREKYTAQFLSSEVVDEILGN